MKLSEIITNTRHKYGAGIGRQNVGNQPITIVRGPNNRICKCDQVKVYKKRVPLDNDGYDQGGVYWGVGKPLYVRFTKDLSYIEFYRL